MIVEDNRVVRLEMPFSDTLTDLIKHIRTWLQTQNIQTPLFRIEDTPGGKIILEIAFPTPDIAAIFQQELAEGLPV